MLQAGMSTTVVSRHFGGTRKTTEHLGRRFRVIGNVADRPRSGRRRVTTAADDRYIILQHLRSSNWKTVWYSSTDCQKSVETKRPYFGQIFTRRQRTARRGLSGIGGGSVLVWVG